MAESLEVGISDLLFEFFADADVFRDLLQPAGAVSVFFLECFLDSFDDCLVVVELDVIGEFHRLFPFVELMNSVRYVAS